MTKMFFVVLGLWITPILIIAAIDKNGDGLGLFQIAPLVLWIIIGFIKSAKGVDVIGGFIAALIINAAIILGIYNSQNLVGFTVIVVWAIMIISQVIISIIKNVRS